MRLVILLGFVWSGLKGSTESQSSGDLVAALVYSIQLLLPCQIGSEISGFGTHVGELIYYRLLESLLLWDCCKGW